jgi:hypothetical protein
MNERRYSFQESERFLGRIFCFEKNSGLSGLRRLRYAVTRQHPGKPG